MKALAAKLESSADQIFVVKIFLSGSQKFRLVLFYF